jgi:uncharacterized membrane protein required for colicin V production
MHPYLVTFLKLTAVITIGIVLLLVVGFLLKIVFVAAIIAAIAAAGFFVYTLVRRRSNMPVIR